MDRIQRIQQQRAREAAERNRLYARIDREAARRVVTQVPLPKARPTAVPKVRAENPCQPPSHALPLALRVMTPLG